MDEQQWQLLLNYCRNLPAVGEELRAAEKFAPFTILPVNYNELFIDKLARGKLPGNSRDDGNFLRRPRNPCPRNFLKNCVP